MDFLKAEIANKRKAVAEDERPKKYMRKGDLEKLEREQALEKNKNKELMKAQTSRTRSPVPVSPTPVTGSPAPEGNTTSGELAHVPHVEIIRRLRLKGQPVTLFGESDRSRRLRLRAFELIEERGPDRGPGVNDFKRALEALESEQFDGTVKGGKAKDPTGEKTDNVKKVEKEVEEIRLEWVKEQPEKLYPAIYFALKKTLKEWEQAMAERPDSVKRTAQGKLAAATQVQSAEYMKPLFKQLRARSLPDDMLARLAEIVHHMQRRQYQRANDSYLRLSIGNAPWPIGVTMVGIHERSAREKISSDQVAHVLNDEVSRKYIQSLKRLLTFSQTKYPPEDISQLMG